MAPILGIIASGISGHLFNPTGNYESIATITVGSGGAANAEFTSIPSTYSHLQLRAITRCAGSGIVSIDLQVNGVTSSTYAWHRVYGDGSSASAYAEPNTSKFTEMYQPISTDTSNAFGAFVWDLLDYANTNKYKTARVLTAYDVNGSNGKIALVSGLYPSTNAVGSIKLISNGGNFAQNSHFALYGIKG